MRLHRLLVLTVGLMTAVGLVLSNPTTDDYLRFVEQELIKLLERMDQTTPTREQQFIRQIFRAQSKNLLEGIVRPHTVRHNLGVCSTYTTHIMDTDVLVLGIAGRFVPVRGVQEASIKIGRMAF